MLDWLKNTFVNRNRYKTHSEACIVSCFYNPQNSPYRLLAFYHWYKSIKHLNHRIIECLIGPDAKSQLPESPYIEQVHADELLWHKETLLNKVFASLPEEYQYIFWVDADVLMTNLNWLVDGVEALQSVSIIQPFEYCVHLKKNQLRPDFEVDFYKPQVSDPKTRHPMMWRSFCANYATNDLSNSTNYDVHGHVGFAWGARRELLEQVPLYDRALIGGSDHILAHAVAGQVPHNCIAKSFTDNLDDVNEWSMRMSAAVDGVGYVPGDLYHIWHGDVEDRQYLQRIRDFTAATKETQKDGQGFYTMPGKNAAYMRRYYRQREVLPSYNEDFGGLDAGFYEEMGYMLVDLIQIFGQPTIYESEPAYDQYQPEAVQGVPPAEVPLDWSRPASEPVQGGVPGPDTVPELSNLVSPLEQPDPVPAAEAMSSNFS